MSTLPANTPNPLNDICEKRVKSFTSRLDTARDEASDENIRKLRVALKKLRTFFGLLELISPHRLDHHRLKKALSQLFRRAGQVRDSRLSLASVPALQLSTQKAAAYRHFLKKRVRKANRKLKKALKGFPLNHLTKTSRRVLKLSRKTSPETVTGTLRTYIGQEVDAIQRIWAAESTPEQSHLLRKHLKRLRYGGHFLIQIDVDDSLNRLLMRVEKAESRLGVWHDKVAQAGQFTTFRTHLPGKVSRKTADEDTLIQQLTQQNERYRKQVVNSLAPLIRSL